MAKLNLADIKSGSLVSQVRDEVAEFYHNGEEMSVDIKIKQLPFVETEALLKRMNNKENVVSEWISKALVDEKGKTMFTQAQIENNFVQALASAVFDIVYGVENIKKSMAKAKKEV